MLRPNWSAAMLSLFAKLRTLWLRRKLRCELRDALVTARVVLAPKGGRLRSRIEAVIAEIGFHAFVCREIGTLARWARELGCEREMVIALRTQRRIERWLARVGAAS